MPTAVLFLEMRQNMNATGKRKGQGAFTLIEVLTGMGVVGLMTSFLCVGFSYGFGLVQMSREDLRATQILTQQIEAIRLCRWSSLTNLPVSFTTRYDPAGAGGAGTGNTYKGTITTNAATAIPTNALYRANMCQLTVTVYWTNYLGKQTVLRQRQMQTQVARYGMQNYIWGTP